MWGSKASFGIQIYLSTWQFYEETLFFARTRFFPRSLPNQSSFLPVMGKVESHVDIFLAIFTVLFFCDIAAQAGLSSEQPKNSDIEVTLSGALARRNLAELLILLGQCRFNEQKDCPDPLTLNSFPPPPDKSLSEVELYAAAQRRGIWPATERVGFESAFSAYYRSKVNQYGEEKRFRQRLWTFEQYARAPQSS